ncbi:MAG: PHP domain-containing protein [Clostridia bacterium]|nr:PHP domain-containing protein [Clostridia bacterium]
MKLIDLHNHTTFSYDGVNSCEEIIENALSKGIEVIGICDHQYSLGSDIGEYIRTVNECKRKYKNKIEVLCGLEIGTRPEPRDLVMSSIKDIDYCLFECLDSPVSMDFYEFLEWVKLFDMPKGFAHTDIFSLSQRYGIDIIKIMKENNIFWEINTSGNYTYYYDFITNKEKQEIIKKSGLTLSVGSDTHWIKDLNVNKLKSCQDLIEKLGNPIIFS